MQRSRTLRARKDHWCASCRTMSIRKGDLYRSVVASPYDEDNDWEHWVRLKECAACAARYGRPSLEDSQRVGKKILDTHLISSTVKPLSNP